MAYLLRPRVTQTGPREVVIVVYVLDTATPGAVETHFLARVERTGTRARHAMAEMVAAVVEALGSRPRAEIVRDDAAALAVLARIK